MTKHETDGMTGPVVQKREVLLVAGLIASWIAVVYFLVSSPKNHPDFLTPRKTAARVPRSDISSAILKRHLEEIPVESEEEEIPQVFAPMDRGDVDVIFKSMKMRSSERPSWFGSLISAESAAPALSDQTLVLEEVIRGVDQQTSAPDETSEQEGELLESEPPEIPLVVPASGESVPSEPIKS